MPLERAVPTGQTTAHRPGSRFSVPRRDDKLGRALRWLRWPVVVIWLLAIVALNPLASSLSSVTSNSASAYLPSSADSTKVVELEQAALHRPGKPDVDPVIVVFARDGGLTAADRAAIASAHATVARLSQDRPRPERARQARPIGRRDGHVLRRDRHHAGQQRDGLRHRRCSADPAGGERRREPRTRRPARRGDRFGGDRHRQWRH